MPTDQEKLEAARRLAGPLEQVDVAYTYAHGLTARIEAIDVCRRLLAEPVLREQLFENKLRRVQEGLELRVRRQETGRWRVYVDESVRDLLAAIADYRRAVNQ